MPNTHNLHIRAAAGAITFAVLVSSCASAGDHGASTPSSPSVEPGVSASSYAVPASCPSASDFGTAWLGDASAFESVDSDDLAAIASEPFPAGGCSYVSTTTTTTDSGSQFRQTNTVYFRLGEDGRLTIDDLLSWGISIGGTPSEEEDLQGNATGEYSDSAIDLPDIGGFTNSQLVTADGVNRSIFFEDETIPEYTTGANGYVRAAFGAEALERIIAAGESGVDLADPLAALAAGVPASMTASFSISDDDGYTADYEITATLPPFEAYVADSKPGQFEAVTSPSASATVTNTTAGRNMTAWGARVYAVYPKESSVCNIYNDITITNDAGDLQDSPYCGIAFTSVPGVELSDGATLTVESGATAQLSVGPLEEGTEALAQLNSPVSVVVGFGFNPGRTFPSLTGTPGCVVLLDGAMWVVTMAGWPDVLCG